MATLLMKCHGQSLLGELVAPVVYKIASEDAGLLETDREKVTQSTVIPSDWLVAFRR